MATKLVTVSGSAWTAITTNGQSGSCWLNTNVVGYGNVAIDHSTASGIDCTIAKSLILHRDYGTRLSFTADYLADVFYARCIDPNGSVVLTIDAY